MSVVRLKDADDVRSALEAFSLSRLLTWSVGIGVFDALAADGATAEEIAAHTGADRVIVGRALEALNAVGLVSRTAESVYSLTPVGHLLQREHPSGLARTAEFLHSAGWDAWSDLADANWRPGYEQIDPFDALSARGLSEAFQAQMHAAAQRYSNDVARRLATRNKRRYVDIGGGTGALARAILDQDADTFVTVLDRPEALPFAARTLSGVAEGRWAVQRGDFFDSVPTGFEVLLLSRILHDWPDQRAARILDACRKSMDDAATLVVFEKVATVTNTSSRADFALTNLNTYIMCGGAERTLEEFDALLSRAGFIIDAVEMITDAHALIFAKKSGRTHDHSTPVEGMQTP